LLLREEKNTASTLNAKQNNELCDTPLASALWAIASQFCHLNLLVEKRRKNRGLRLFSAEGNKRGLIGLSCILTHSPTTIKLIIFNHNKNLGLSEPLLQDSLVASFKIAQNRVFVNLKCFSNNTL
jgi:hypothetical protein